MFKNLLTNINQFSLFRTILNKKFSLFLFCNSVKNIKEVPIQSYCLSVVRHNWIAFVVVWGALKMKIIPLSQGYFAQVDDEDFDFLNQWTWRAAVTKRVVYVKRDVFDKETKTSTAIYMHRLLMSPDTKMVVDHVDHNGLNNQKINLRICTQTENKQNRRPNKLQHRTSIYKGVCYAYRKVISRGKEYYYYAWQARIQNKTLGIFKTEVEAALAYDNKAIELFGEFANLNFKEPSSVPA